MTATAVKPTVWALCPMGQAKLDAAITRSRVYQCFAESSLAWASRPSQGWGQVMDEILWSEEDGFTAGTNNLGGFEGGMTKWSANRARCHEAYSNPLQATDDVMLAPMESHKAMVEL